MNRREFGFSLLGVSAAAALCPAFALPRLWPESSPEIAELYRKSIIMDSLCSLFTDGESPHTAAQVAELRRSGITAINSSITGDDFDQAAHNIEELSSLVERFSDALLIVGRHSDIARAKRENKIGIIPGFQQTTFLEDKPGRIEFFRERGVRIMQLTYNRHSAFGDGCLEPQDHGLSAAGRGAVKKMNNIGVAIDLSHSGHRTTAEGIATSSKPVLISHAGCAGVYAHPRNKPDEILKQLADRGGYFGVYLMPYLVASPTVPTREHVLEHLVHAINVCGADHVGVGCDGSIEKVVLTPERKKAFDEDIVRRKRAGIGAPGEDRFPYVPDLNGPDHMLVVAEELAKRGQPSSVIEKVLGANFQRVLGEIWGKS